MSTKFQVVVFNGANVTSISILSTINPFLWEVPEGIMLRNLYFCGKQRELITSKDIIISKFLKFQIKNDSSNKSGNAYMWVITKSESIYV